MSVAKTVLEVHQLLRDNRVPHAFGGALALAYVAEPRGTVDVDVNVFVPQDDRADVVALFATLGYRAESDALPIAGTRFRREGDVVPVDVFLSLDPAYEEIQERVVEHPFGPEKKRLPFLSPEDLVVFKLSFGRDRDWTDIRAIARAGATLDLDYIERQLLALRGPTMHPRLARLRATLSQPG